MNVMKKRLVWEGLLMMRNRQSIVHLGIKTFYVLCAIRLLIVKEDDSKDRTNTNVLIAQSLSTIRFESLDFIFCFSSWSAFWYSSMYENERTQKYPSQAESLQTTLKRSQLQSHSTLLSHLSFQNHSHLRVQLDNQQNHSFHLIVLFKTSISTSMALLSLSSSHFWPVLL